MNALERWSGCALLCAAMMGIGLDAAAQARPGAAPQPTKNATTLRVEAEATATGIFDVFVDGERVGTTPWEGPVDVGERTVRIANDKLGSTPTRVDAFEGEVNVLRLAARPLGPPIRVEVNPQTAELMLENAFIGTGRWVGRLPLGLYTLSASERGYRRFKVTVRVVPADEPQIVRILLEVDPDHPRWPKPRRGLSWLVATAGFGWTPSLNGGAEAVCPAACMDHAGPLGFFGGMRGGYGFRSGLSLELEAGYLQLDTAFERRKTDSFAGMQETAFRLGDLLRLAGPFVSGGVGYRLPLGDWFALSAGLHVGVVIAASSDPVSGYVTIGNATHAFAVEDAIEPVRSVALYLMPEIAALMRLGPLEFGPVLRVGGFPLDGPDFEHNSIRVTSPSVCGATSCAWDFREPAYGPFIMISPQLRLGFVFH